MKLKRGCFKGVTRKCYITFMSPLVHGILQDTMLTHGVAPDNGSLQSCPHWNSARHNAYPRGRARQRQLTIMSPMEFCKTQCLPTGGSRQTTAVYVHVPTDSRNSASHNDYHCPLRPATADATPTTTTTTTTTTTHPTPTTTTTSKVRHSSTFSAC
jgi:hypothetical protein